MLKYLTKFVVDIFPSVAATVIGAYIVNHYIVAKPEAPAAAAVSTAQPKAAAASKPVEKPAEVSNLPEAGVKARGMSERTLMERTASEKATVTEKPQDKAQEKSADSKSPDAPAETASIPAEPRRHQPATREKTVAKVTPPPGQTAPAPAAAPAAPGQAVAPPTQTEAVAAPEERRDANDLARAAIERLRGGGDGAPRVQETARVTEVPRVPEASRVVTAPSLRPLPPPIMVSTPPSEAWGQTSQPRPPYQADATDDPNRPTPPAEIPARPPLDLRAEAAEPAKDRPNIGEDMLSSMKSVFHAVLPK
ncbi:hypothetical protein [Bradyrhizobium sp. USDA 10063]